MIENDNEKTMTFSVVEDKDSEIKRVLLSIYAALDEKGYVPIDHIVGYIITEDPTYITNYKNARSLIRKIDRYELLSVLLKSYMGV